MAAATLWGTLLGGLITDSPDPSERTVELLSGIWIRRWRTMRMQCKYTTHTHIEILYLTSRLLLTSLPLTRPTRLRDGPREEGLGFDPVCFAVSTIAHVELKSFRRSRLEGTRVPRAWIEKKKKKRKKKVLLWWKGRMDGCWCSLSDATARFGWLDEIR